MKKIDPRSPGQSSDDDCFKNPNGTAGGPGSGPHAGMGRDDDGSFNNKTFSRGGISEDGDAMVAKYRPGRSGGGSSDTIPDGSELNEDGDGYA